MASGKDDKKPLGQKIRDLINPALADERKLEITLDALDGHFFKLSIAVPRMLEQGYSQLFNSASLKSVDSKDLHPEIIKIVVLGEEDDIPLPFIGLPLPFNPLFVFVSADELLKLPGYVRFHEAMRKIDVAVKLKGLGFSSPDEPEPGGQPMEHPAVIINTLKRYEDDRDLSYPIQPDEPVLPPPPSPRALPPASGKKGGDFEF